MVANPYYTDCQRVAQCLMPALLNVDMRLEP